MSTVIKTQHRAAGSSAVAFNLDDVSAHAERYLDTVRAQAEAILDDARVQAGAILKSAEQQGRLAAQRAAQQAAEQRLAEQLTTLLPALRQSIEELRQARHEWLAHWERQAVHLAAAIAGRIVRRELSQHPQISQTLIREALEMAAGSSQVRLMLNPEDHRVLVDQVRLWAAEYAPAGSVEIVADAAITAGGCRIETRFGVIDQQIETQLRRIEEELT